MGELGVSHTRLVMPTRENCAQLESLLEAAAALVETKKQVDRIEHETMVMQERLGSRTSEGAENDMDVDEEGGDAEAVGEDGRGQSVVSTRSVRSNRPRKKVRFTHLMSTKFNHVNAIVCAVNVNIFGRYCRDWWSEEETILDYSFFPLCDFHRFSSNTYQDYKVILSLKSLCCIGCTPLLYCIICCIISF